MRIVNYKLSNKLYSVVVTSSNLEIKIGDSVFYKNEKFEVVDKGLEIEVSDLTIVDDIITN